MHKIHGLLFAMVFAVASDAGYAQGGWKPEKNVEIVVGSGAGTGTDRVARLIQKIWQENKALDVPLVVVNKPGGGGAISWAYLNQHVGDPHYLEVTSYNIVTGYLTGKSKLTYADFTPISLLAREYVAYSVRTESPITNIRDFVNALKQDPGAIPVGVSSSAGGANHIALGVLMKAAGVDVNKMKVVVFPGSGAAIAALLGGHVGLFVNSLSATAPPVINGTARALAVAAPHRLGGIYATVPTLKETGFPVTAENWRLMIAPRGLTQAQTSYWDIAIEKLAGSEEWKKELEANYLPNNYLSSAETQRYIDQQFGVIKGILTDLGLARAPETK